MQFRKSDFYFADETSTKENVQHQHVILLWAWAGLSKTLSYLRP